MVISLEGLNYLKWVTQSLSRKRRNRFFSAIGLFFGACLVISLTWWVIYAPLWIIALSLGVPMFVVSLTTWILWGLLFVAYVAVNRRREKKMDFVAPTQQRIDRAAAILGESVFQTLSGPQTVGPFVRGVSAICLAGPSLLVASWKLLMQAVSAGKAAPEDVAEVLQTIGTAGVRISIEELVRVESLEKTTTKFQALKLFDGLVLRTSEPVGIVLEESFRKELLSMIPKDKHQFLTPKSPSGRVPSKGPQSAAGSARPNPKPRR